jgi:hypothetical protein
MTPSVLRWDTVCAVSFGEGYPDIFVFVRGVVVGVLFACERGYGCSDCGRGGE